MTTPSALPAEVTGVLDRYFTAELSTHARDHTPVTVPVAPLWLPERGQILVTTGIGVPHKAFRARRDPRVALLYSNPVASGLDDPPAVLVQGNASVSEIVTWDDELARQFHKVWTAQPKGVGADPITKRLFWWYYMRLEIHIRPVRIRWWPGRDMTAAPHEEVLL
ncbi:pyridoxamine 5'-phosphate oxidase family protein [Nocardia huaxiensis]|uniref:Pyridoxamine 5'-phosphate oxidase n=1 Tax=Nocardia huaxiensis TaxID=2755382 RepID=A0A7D6VFI4_9NOCA|nr:pyridoxamine 5'-phosphate oxidase family protein [Nocardia huaxiensis]QLY33853.1 pyridoxamine 5'-phosphate oxidase [Nocardia huaxiensis]UFS99217.1 pyridoxamine 5'-phosphate oxidase family protein [Nocardia huaxiensis]